MCNIIKTTEIWGPNDLAEPHIRRFELTDMIRFDAAWFCGFHEGVIHDSHPAGRARIIRSEDGVTWSSVALLTWNNADVREPRMSITADGFLMVNSAVSQIERKGFRQSVTWLSSDGIHWSDPFACASGADTWRWDCTWQDGHGYSVGYAGKDVAGALYRTEDGRTWAKYVAPFFPEGRGNETAIAFDTTHRAIALLRGGPSVAMLGIAEGPEYKSWKWKSLTFDWHADGKTIPADEALSAPLGGPKLLRLSDGRMLAAARVKGPGDHDGRIGIFSLDIEHAILTRIAALDATSYAGLAEHDGKLWVTCAADEAADIRIASLACPPSCGSQTS